jgi:hypothetical protein
LPLVSVVRNMTDLLIDVFMNAFYQTSYGPSSEPRKDVIVSEWIKSRDKSGPKMTLTHLRQLLTESIDMGHLCKSVPITSEAPNPIRSPNSTPDDPTYAMAASGGGGGGSSVDRRKSEGVKDKPKGSNDRNRTRSPTALTTTKPKNGGTLELLYDDISSQGMSVIKTHFPHLIGELTRKVKLCNKLGDKHGVATRFLDAERFQQINQEIREIEGMSTEDRQKWTLFRETGQGKNITFGQMLRKAPTIDEDGKIMKSMSARRHAAAPPQLEAASSKLVGPPQHEVSTLKSAMKDKQAIDLMKEKKVSANTKKASVNALKSAPQESNSPKMVTLDQVTDEVLAEMGISSIHMTPKKIQRLKKSLSKINWADDLDGGSSDEDASDEYEDISDSE